MPLEVTLLRRLPWPARRSSAETAAAFESWLGDRMGGFFAWVHLDAYVDLDVPEGTLVVVASAYGDGEGLSEGAVHVPLWMASESMPQRYRVVEAMAGMTRRR